MAEEPENHTLRLLREMREETNCRFDEMREEMNRRFDETFGKMNRRLDETRGEMNRRLDETRGEMSRRFDETRGEMGEMREEMKEIRAQTNLIPKLAGDVAELQLAVAAMRADQTRANEVLETVAETQKNQGMRLNAIDGRLALCEKHTGLVKA
jgi:hypothetical protein